MKTSKPVIIDTSALVSLVSDADSNHRSAVAISTRIASDHRPVVLPGEVFTETLNIVGKKISREKQLDLGSDLLTSQTFTIIETSSEIRRLAFEKLRKQPASVSYTDCVVMAFADYFETTDIFGFDQTFRKNGYTLPK